jgi:hypothetical protein
MLLIARTDAESGKLLSSNVDVADHEFILGTTTRGSVSLAQALSDAEARGASGAEVDELEQEWTQRHETCTFNQGELAPSAEGWFNKTLKRIVCVKLLRKLYRTRIALRTSLLPTKLTSPLLMESPTMMLETLLLIFSAHLSFGTVIVSELLERISSFHQLLFQYPGQGRVTTTILVASR